MSRAGAFHGAGVILLSPGLHMTGHKILQMGKTLNRETLTRMRLCHADFAILPPQAEETGGDACPEFCRFPD